MPAYLFYPRRADGVSLTFIADSAENDVEALQLAASIGATHQCVSVFVWESASDIDGKDRFVGEVESLGEGARRETTVERGVSAPA